MVKTKGKWTSVCLLKTIYGRIRKVLPYTGTISVSEYIRFAIQERLKFDEIHAEDQKMLETEVKERLE